MNLLNVEVMKGQFKTSNATIPSSGNAGSIEYL